MLTMAIARTRKIPLCLMIPPLKIPLNKGGKKPKASRGCPVPTRPDTNKTTPKARGAFAPFNKGESLIFMLCAATASDIGNSYENSKNLSLDRQGGTGPLPQPLPNGRGSVQPFHVLWCS